MSQHNIVLKCTWQMDFTPTNPLTTIQITTNPPATITTPSTTLITTTAATTIPIVSTPTNHLPTTLTTSPESISTQITTNPPITTPSTTLITTTAAIPIMSSLPSKYSKYKKGDIVSTPLGIKKRFTGKRFQRLCSEKNCYFCVLYKGYCYKHCKLFINTTSATLTIP